MTRPIPLLAATLALIAIVLLAGRTGEAHASGVVGDTTCDAHVRMNDVLPLMFQSAGLPPNAACIYNGDTNCDGHYTADDALRIVAYIAGLPAKAIAGCVPVGSVYQTTPSPTPILDPTPPIGDPTPTASPSPEISPPPGQTFTPTPTATATPTLTPTPTATPTHAPTHTPTPTPTRTPTPTPGPTPTPLPTPLTGIEPTCNVFPANNPWNTDVSTMPVDQNSANYLAAIGTQGAFLHPDFGTVWDNAPIGIPYVVVGANQPKVPVSFDYADESDPGPYPIPPNVPVEGQPVGQPNTAGFGGDRHVLVVDDSACKLYELYDAHPVNGGQSWTAGSGAVFDLNSNTLRPDTWTSADAAGLPIFAGLVRYAEVQSGTIDHALRFTVDTTQMAFIHPATHYASDNTDPNQPPMGLRFRMKANYDCSWATPEVQVICTAMKKYGMIVADNGSDWYVSGAPDPRWNDDHLNDVKQIPASAFEVVDTGESIHTGY